MKLKALGTNVLVKPTKETEETTESGIIIPSSAKPKPIVGEVFSKGADVNEVNVGDKVMYGAHAGVEINFEGDNYLMLKITDIFAVL